MIARWKQAKAFGPLADPMTGYERLTWRVMTIYRSFFTLLFLQALTILWWLRPEWFPGGLPGWNYVWSALAVDVEMLVGICFLAQMVRDGRVIREELAALRELMQFLHAKVDS